MKMTVIVMTTDYLINSLFKLIIMIIVIIIIIIIIIIIKLYHVLECAFKTLHELTGITFFLKKTLVMS